MKYLFIKSGGYAEHNGRKLGGAINDFLSTNIYHFVKNDTSFKLNLINGQYQIHKSQADAQNPKNIFAVVDFEEIVSKLGDYSVVYAGVETDVTDVVSQEDIINNFKLIGINQSKQLVNLTTGQVINKSGVIPLLFAVKMNNSTGYAAFLTSLMHLENIQSSFEPVQLAQDITAFYIDDGDSIRSNLLNVTVKNVDKSFLGEPFQTSSMVFARTNQTVEVDLFKTAANFTSEFKNGFSIEVDSNLGASVVDNKIVFNTGTAPKTGYLTFTVLGTPVYYDVSGREPKEILIYKIAVSVY